MVHFGILDCPIFLSLGPPVLLEADVSIMAVSYIIASVIKTLSRSLPSWVEVHRWWCPWSVPPRPKEDKVDTSSTDILMA
jgi:hypothetical protein